MDQDERLTARLEAARDECEAWRPRFFRLAKRDDRQELMNLLDEHADTVVHDALMDQLIDLLKTRSPSLHLSDNAARELVQPHLGGVRPDEYGVWVYYPWSRRLVHLLDELEFVELRTNRNKYKITPEEQARLTTKKVGIVGLSVGHAVATTLALERSVGEVRLADYDRLDLSNLNRIRSSVYNLGVSKVLITAREIAEIDPFLKVVVYPVGVHDDNLSSFILRGGKLDLLIDECDSIDIKLKLRTCARAHGIPVVMETSDRSLIDVERFDREPTRPIFHGLVGDIEPERLANLSTEDKIPYVLKIIGADTMSSRMVASMLEIETSIKTWPQLGSCVVYGGGATADIVRRINLGHMTYSGRFIADIERVVPNDPPVACGSGGASTPTLTDARMVVLADTMAAPRAARAWEPDVAGELVAIASRAPSGGNMQPWRWLLRGGRLHLFHDRSRSEGLTDFRGLAATASLGAALESLRMAAQARGIHLAISRFPGPPDLLAVVERLADGADGDEPRWREDLAPLLGARHTNRKSAVRQTLEPTVFESMRAAANSIAGADLHFIDDDEGIAEVGELVGAADRLRMLHGGLHREMYGELRWTADDAETTRDGIFVDSLELSPSDRTGLLLCRRHEALAFLGTLAAGRGLPKMAIKAFTSVSAVGLLTVPSATASDFLRGGQAMQRMWLVAHALGIALCPMTVLSYMFARLHAGGEGLDPPTIAELRHLWPLYAQLFPVTAGTGQVLLFRLTRADPPSVESLRRPVEEILHIRDA